MINFASNTSVYYQIFTCNCSIFSYTISVSEILQPATYRTWCKHYDPFGPTLSGFPYPSLCPFQWPSSTPCKHLSLTSMLVESIWEHWMWHSHAGALGFPQPRCHCLTLYHIRCMPPSCLRLRLDSQSHQSSLDNVGCRKCYQVHNPHHLQLVDIQFVWCGRHLILYFIFRGGSVLTKLVAKVICLTV